MSTDFQSFDLTRDIKAKPATVYRTWAEPALKERWFTWQTNPAWQTDLYEADLRDGGRELARFTHAEMGSFTYDARLIQMLAGRRILYSYTMHHGDMLLSLSQSTVTLTANGAGTRLVYTEQVVFLDGGDRMETRMAGTIDLLGRMVATAEGDQNA